MNNKHLCLLGSLALGCFSLGAGAQQLPLPTAPPLVEVPGTEGAILTQNVTTIDQAFWTALSGTAEVPPQVTDATGLLAVSLNPDGASLHYRLSVNNIDNLVAAHLHLGLPGENGPVVVPLLGEGAPGGTTPPPGMASGVIAEGDISAGSLTGPLAGTPLVVLLELMRSGAIYANVHSTDFPEGEMRGQVEGVGPDPRAGVELLQGTPGSPGPIGVMP